MKPNLAGVCLCAVLLGALGTGTRADDTAVRRDIQSILSHAAQSLQKKDIDGLAKTMPANVTFTFPDGKTRTLQEWAEVTKQSIAPTVNLHLTMSLDRLTVT